MNELNELSESKKWTEDQEKVINLGSRNILVSAAAGSGKTAVLVERIIEIITNKYNKIDIDRLLIVTFTNVAASEMRERISQAIEKKIMEQPNNSHIQKQQTLVHNSQITTIHSVCLNIIRNNFNVIELDPSFRVAETAELDLLKSDVLQELLEKHYEQKDEKFYDFIESYSTGKTDSVIEGLILQLYTFSQSYPEPEYWLNGLRKTFDVSTQEDLEQMDFIKFLLNYISEIVKGLEDIIGESMEICTSESGPYIYLDALTNDKILIRKLKTIDNYKSYSEILYGLKWSKLSSKRDENISLEKRETVKMLRNGIKENIDNIRKNYFFQSLTGMIEDIEGSKAVMNVLIDLVIEFSNDYAQSKISKNILDFNDLEHKALNILVKRDENEKYIETFIAQDLSEYYKEIFIDEYQDSNLVQEIILNSISKEKSGRPNVFMVGDVKQSIYKFRLARPELFMKKYENYSTEDSLYQLVKLHKNFRSRKEILNFINFMFGQIMDKKLGGIDYNDDTALYQGKDFKKCEFNININPELIIVDLSKDILNESDRDEFDYTSKEIEAKAIAERIKNIVDGSFKVYDEKLKCYRNAKYKDIVIILRTISGWANVFEEILMKQSIPAHSEASTGYFSTVEIQTIISILKIIDNPIQDIPLTAVLRSPIAGISSYELAVIKSEFKSMNMYNAVQSYIEYGSEEKLRHKLSKFDELINNFRQCVPYTSIHDIICRILDDTEYYDYVSAMPSGAKRRANIDMLIERAVQFESTSYKGLFNFIRYIDKIRDYEIDFGEASILGENEDVVRIMSIHKSKGLEFPIVFVSGLGKMFNNQDARSRVVIHSDLGIGPDYVDYKLRIKSPTIIKKIIAKRIVLENLGEELRILYVALTRAKEKLILTGTVKQHLEKILFKLSEIMKFHTQEKLPFTLLSSANTYLDWIIPALMRHSSFNNILNEKGIYMNEVNSKYSKDIAFDVNVVDLSKLIGQEIQSQLTNEVAKDELIYWNYSNKIFDNDIHNEIQRRLSWSYSHINEVNLHAKMTVTELKMLSQNIDDERSQNIINIYDDKIVPKFLDGFIEVKATQRGTIIHKVMQNIDFKKINELSDIYTEVEYLNKIGKISNDEKKLVNLKQIYNFVISPLANRMKNANNKLFKEQQFIIGIKARDISSDFNSDELVLVQGIIDVYFEENGEIVLVDYKTDKVNDESLLIKRYSNQLNYYQRAIEQTTKKRIKEKIIYSFNLNRAITL